MTAAQMAAVVAVAMAETPEERVVRVRGALERWGLLGLVAEVALAHHVELDELLGRTRVPQVAAARARAWARLHGERFWSCEQLGPLFAVDPTTVRDALKKAAPDAAAERTAT